MKDNKNFGKQGSMGSVKRFKVEFLKPGEGDVTC